MIAAATLRRLPYEQAHKAKCETCEKPGFIVAELVCLDDDSITQKVCLDCLAIMAWATDTRKERGS